MSKTTTDYQVDDIVKLKKIELPYQASIRYKVTKVLKTTLHLEEVEDKFQYKNVKKSLVTIA